MISPVCMQVIVLVASLVCIAAIRQDKQHSRRTIDKPLVYGHRVVQAYPHDPAAFTQGLEFEHRCIEGGQSCKDILWESTGLNGQSSVREVELQTGKVLRKKMLSKLDFGEGLVKFKNRLYQLTWQTPKGYSYNVDNFDDTRSFFTPLQDGWGAATDGKSLILSDGSSRLTWVEPTSFARERTVEVKDGKRVVRNLNELEWVEGEIWANVWLTECIARIDPSTGRVKSWVVLDGMRSKLQREAGVQTTPMDVLNGIAYDKQRKRVFITGKNWSKLYEIEVMLQQDKFGQKHNLDDTRMLCIK